MRKVTETILDDLDKSEGATTVLFGFEGKSYEIDLSTASRDKLVEALAPFITAGREVRRTRTAGASRTSDVDPVAVRTWAKENGHTVSDRGRLSGKLIEDFKAATGS